MNKPTQHAFVAWLTSPTGYRGPLHDAPYQKRGAQGIASQVARAERDLRLDYGYQFRGVSSLQFELDRLRLERTRFGELDDIGLNGIATAVRCYSKYIAQLP